MGGLNGMRWVGGWVGGTDLGSDGGREALEDGVCVFSIPHDSATEVEPSLAGPAGGY